MSHLDVRQGITAELQTFLNAQVPPVTYVESINKYNGQLPLEYVTIAFSVQYVEDLCIGGKSRVERGTAEVIVRSESGGGYQFGVQLINAIEEHFWGRELTPATQIQSTSGVIEYSSGDAQDYYTVAVNLYYLHYI